MNKIIFRGNSVRPQYMRSDDSVRITIDISEDQLPNVEDILCRRLPDKVNYIITIEPEVEEL